MAIPGYQTFMLPVLQLAADGEEHCLAEAREVLARQFNLSEEELQRPVAQRLRSGVRQPPSPGNDLPCSGCPPQSDT